ncbi:putative amidase [Glarea lozoyensis 74030]|uniref:Putative amidase n=1 Tax=Glarea lozoyensis (strain ATCC 74030 / MF5533) TaxID=1104152 RepID=H0EKY7_GLAL7|nr:putative amidase [Glarea lozoyensis 74030]
MGSSGGEGALVGFRASLLGIGTDIGGSIRGPAANCGLKAVGGGQEQIVPTIGPLSTSLEGLKIFTKTLIDAKPWLREPGLLPFPWKEEDFFNGRKIKVAVIWDDGVVKPQPPVTRALKEVVDKLASSDKFEVVDWKPYQHDRAWEIISWDGTPTVKNKVDVSKDSVDMNHEPRNERDEENVALWKEHGAEGYKDAPVSLQLVGRRYVDTVA